MVKYWPRVIWLVLLCSALFGCSKSKTPVTELILVADTDITNLELVRFEVSEGQRNESEEDTPRADGQPLTLGVVHSTGSLGPIRVSALGLRGGRTVVEHSAVVSFVPGKTLVVELHLLASCEATRCLSTQTCNEGACVPNELDADQLSTWNGTAPEIADTFSSDAGQGDAGIAGSDAGSRADSGSDLVTCGNDQRVDLSSDVNHCGDCKTVCKTSGRNTVASCVAGACSEECRALFGDCDDNASNGCEQALTVSTHCGMCGMRCATGMYCSLGVCR